MREILFRGKRVDNGEWIHGYYAKNADGHTYISEPTEMQIGECYLDTYHRVRPTIVGQYTGLNDMHGVRIFEGDIVKMLSQDSRGIDYDEVLTVAWSDDVCGFVGLNKALIRDGMYAPLTSHDRIEVLEIDVIGNRWDNPELLGEG